MSGVGVGGYSYWARKNLEIAGMINRTEAQGHAGDVTPPRLIFAEKTDCNTGATGINYYSLYSEAAVTPIVGNDLYAGPFYTNYEGTIEITRAVEADRFPTALIKTTHMIPGQDDIVSVRAAPLYGLLVGINETANIGLSVFDSMVNLARDVPGGGKIGLSIELAITIHDTEGNRNSFIRKVQSGEAIVGADTPIINKPFRLVLANSAVSFLQWTKAASGSAAFAGGAPYTVAQCDEVLSRLFTAFSKLGATHLFQVQLPNGVFYTNKNEARLQKAIEFWQARRVEALAREGNYKRRSLTVCG